MPYDTMPPPPEAVAAPSAPRECPDEQSLRFVPGDKKEEKRQAIAARLLLYLRGLDVRFPACFTITRECVQEAEQLAPPGSSDNADLAGAFHIMQDKLRQCGAGPFERPDSGVNAAQLPPPLPPLNRHSMVSEKLHFFPSGGAAFTPPPVIRKKTPAPAGMCSSKNTRSVPNGPGSDAAAA